MSRTAHTEVEFARASIMPEQTSPCLIVVSSYWHGRQQVTSPIVSAKSPEPDHSVLATVRSGLGGLRLVIAGEQVLARFRRVRLAALLHTCSFVLHLCRAHASGYCRARRFAFVASGPLLYGSEAFLRQAQQLVGMSANLTDRQKMIAEYWADGPRSELPPGHSKLFAQFVSARDWHKIVDDVKMFFALTDAVFDAGLVAWDSKRAFDSVRPATAIPFLFQSREIQAWGGPFIGTVTMDGARWQPFQAATQPTLAFPEYISGHSTFRAAGAEILKLFTNSDAFGNSVTLAAGSSSIEPGLTPAEPVLLEWKTFKEAPGEAGISRRYGGIHFESGDLVGRDLGRATARQV